MCGKLTFIIILIAKYINTDEYILIAKINHFFSMARSYRHSFIETKGGLKNVLSHKIFCGWDYQIATKETAELKSSSIYQDLKVSLVN